MLRPMLFLAALVIALFYLASLSHAQGKQYPQPPQYSAQPCKCGCVQTGNCVCANCNVGVKLTELPSCPGGNCQAIPFGQPYGQFYEQPTFYSQPGYCGQPSYAGGCSSGQCGQSYGYYGAPGYGGGSCGAGGCGAGAPAYGGHGIFHGRAKGFFRRCH